MMSQAASMTVRPQAPPPAHSLRAIADDILTAGQAAQKRLGSDERRIAIHELRVALKRWRAMLRLLEEPIGDETVVMRHVARLLARELGRSRDAQTVLDAMADLAKQKNGGPQPLPARTEAAITRRLQAMRDTSEAEQLPDELIQSLHDSLTRMSARLASWPLEQISLEDIAAAVARSYRRACRRLPRKWDGTDPEEIHDFRKAVVTLRYQLDLVAPVWPKMFHTFIGETQKLRMQLGKSNDLVVLGALTAPKQPLARWRSHLTPQIERRQRFHLHRAQSLADRVFAESPRSFHKHLAALAKAAAKSA